MAAAEVSRIGAGEAALPGMQPRWAAVMHRPAPFWTFLGHFYIVCFLPRPEGKTQVINITNAGFLFSALKSF
jgi:hypothetical protein